jgi:hypothetical protein
VDTALADDNLQYMATLVMSQRAATTLTVLALALCGPALAAPARASGRPDDCAARQLPAAAGARATHPDGTAEVTAFAPGGGYQVTRCGRDGRPVVSQTVSPILDPDGGSVLVPTERVQDGVTVAMLYGDPADPGWAAQFRAARREIAAQVIPPTVPVPAPVALDLAVQPTEVREGATLRGAGQLARAAVAGDACTNSQFALWESAWGTRTYKYYVNRSRFNYNDTSVASIVDGHRNWDTTYNSCGLNDITNLMSQHLGSTAETIHTYPDGLSVTDKGSLASICPGALACTWLFSGADGRTTETDQRFNEDFDFSNVGAAGAYDYESIATHETGHSIGLDHANSSNALTMYFQIASGTTHARSLAKGDVLGLRSRYP